MKMTNLVCILRPTHQLRSKTLLLSCTWHVYRTCRDATFFQRSDATSHVTICSISCFFFCFCFFLQIGHAMSVCVCLCVLFWQMMKQCDMLKMTQWRWLSGKETLLRIFPLLPLFLLFTLLNFSTLLFLWSWDFLFLGGDQLLYCLYCAFFYSLYILFYTLYVITLCTSYPA